MAYSSTEQDAVLMHQALLNIYGSLSEVLNIEDPQPQDYQVTPHSVTHLLSTIDHSIALLDRTVHEQHDKLEYDRSIERSNREEALRAEAHASSQSAKLASLFAMTKQLRDSQSMSSTQPIDADLSQTLPRELTVAV